MTTLAELIVQETKTRLLEKALEVATLVGLPVTSWQVDDPTRSLYHALVEELYVLEQVAARYVAAKFLDLAAQLDDSKWIKLEAYQHYGYTAREATFATCTVRLTNAGGGIYTIDALDLVFAKTADPDVTYRNTSGGLLVVGPGSTLDVSIACEQAGSIGSAAIGEISLVTGLTGVAASNTTAAVGVDEESASSIVAGCRAKLEALSPNGAAGAYEHVALNAELTGASNVTRCRVSADDADGTVSVRIASASGEASAPDVALVEAAIVELATPLTITPDVQSASALPITVTVTVTAYDKINATTDEIKAAVVAAVQQTFASIPIGGDGAGYVYRARLISAIMATYPGYVFQVALSAPAADAAVGGVQVATTSITTADVTVSLVAAP